MENPPFVDVFPVGKRWISIAMLVYRRVIIPDLLANSDMTRWGWATPFWTLWVKPRKKNILFMKYWLCNRDPYNIYNGLMKESPHTVAPSLPTPLQWNLREPFFWQFVATGTFAFASNLCNVLQVLKDLLALPFHFMPLQASLGWSVPSCHRTVWVMWRWRVRTQMFPPWPGTHICAMVKSRVFFGMTMTPPLIGNPYSGYIHPHYWVDDPPLLHGNNGSLDPIATYDLSPLEETLLEPSLALTLSFSSPDIY